jgi:hypothetical protein
VRSGPIFPLVLLAAECIFLAVLIWGIIAARGGWPTTRGPADFSHVYAGAQALLRGELPFTPANFDPPTLSLLEVPLALLPFAAAYVVFLGLSVGVLAGALKLWYSRWTRLSSHASVIGGALAILWFPVLHGLSLGQPLPLVLAALLTCFALLHDRRVGLAGVALAVLWIKPDLTIVPIVVLLILLRTQGLRWRRFSAWFAIATAAFFAVQAWNLVPWLRVVASSSGTLVQAKTQVSIWGALAFLVPVLGQAGMGTLLIKGAAAIVVLGGTAALFRWVLSRSSAWRAMPAVQRAVWGTELFIAAWLLITPYAHLYDEALVLPLLLLMVGPRAEGLVLLRVRVLLLLSILVPGSEVVLALPFSFLPIVNLGLLLMAVTPPMPAASAESEAITTVDVVAESGIMRRGAGEVRRAPERDGVDAWSPGTTST